MKTIENLVFKGGGVLGAAYVGAYQALQDARLAGHHKNGTVYGNVKRVAGTSAGSIFGTLVALGHSAEEIAEIMNGKDFSTFVDFDGGDLSRGGLCKGAEFLNWMQCQVESVITPTKNVGSTSEEGGPTFEDLHARAENDKNFKDLHVFSRNIDSGRITEFSYQTTPDVPIAEAVRASMSIPFLFRPWEFAAGGLATAYPGRFIDGGVAFNYPICDFDTDDNLQKTLGFYLMDMSEKQSGGMVMSALQLALHGAEHHFIPKKHRRKIELFLEDAFNFALELRATKHTTSKKQTEATLTALAALAFGDKTNESVPLELIRILAKLVELYFEEKIDVVVNELKELLKNVSSELAGLADFINCAFTYSAIAGATLNSPTNVTFQRDAARTVMVNSLGFSFIDFWIPKCNRDRLQRSGYKCTSAYLDMIMYS